MSIPAGRGLGSAFLGVKGSPVQIRPSRRRSKAGSGFQLPAFGCNGSARALPSVAPAKRSGVPCRPGILTSDYQHSACSRPGSRLSPPTRVSFPPGQGVAGSDPAVKGWFWAKAADGRAPASGCHFVRLSPRRPTSSTRAADAPCHRRWAARRSASWWPTHLTAAVGHWLDRSLSNNADRRSLASATVRGLR
jgi:hypothetical protein